LVQYFFDSSALAKLYHSEPSALARNCHTLLAKSCPPPRPVGWRFGARQERTSCCSDECRMARSEPPGRRLPTHAVLYCNSKALHAFSVHDEEPTRTPSAWMILLAPRQRLFFMWATLNEQKWSTLGERRGSELGTVEVTRILSEPDSRIVISQLTLVEIQSVFSIKVRTGEISREDAELFRQRMVLHVAAGDSMFLW
jgi:hypothetical protein